MKLGSRVIHMPSGGLGIVEAVNEDPVYPTIDVRWLTPRNEPSILVSVCKPGDLQEVSDSVIPMPKSKEWHKRAREFYEMIESAVLELGL